MASYNREVQKIYHRRMSEQSARCDIEPLSEMELSHHREIQIAYLRSHTEEIDELPTVRLVRAKRSRSGQ